MDAVATFPLVACDALSIFQSSQAYGNDYKIVVRVSPEIFRSGKRRIGFSSFPISILIALTALP